jgi:hypothetical protein
LITARRWSAGLLVVGLLVGGCSANLSPAPAVSAAAATAFASSPAATPSVAAPSASPVASAGSSPSASGSAGPAIPIDPLLLAILPVTVGGQPISEMPDIEANLMTDPDLQTNAASLAVALGINSATGDFAYVAIIQLKPLVFSDAWYASWRQSYDEGACSQSSGLKSTSSTTIAGRRVFVGHCAGGALTYHVHLTGPDRVVSITSVGSAGFGALVVSALEP